MAENINDITKHDESGNDYTTRTIHVGATENKLESLKKALTPHFDSIPAFQAKRTGWHNTVEEYFLQGKINGIDYLVYVYCSECPTQILMTHIHEASVAIPKGIKDELTPTIEREFRVYQSEVAEREKIAEQSVPTMEAAVARAKEKDGQRKNETACVSIMDRLNYSVE